MTRIKFLLNNIPEWVEVISKDNDSFEFNAKTVLSNGRKGVVFSLVAKNSASKVEVKEKVTEHLPKQCPERHIDKGGVFCLLKSDPDWSISSDFEAQQWWEWLNSFLTIQQCATKRGLWPTEAAWVHGAAADQQKIIEQIGTKLGWNINEINSIIFGKNVVASFFLNYEINNRLFIQRRADCPFGCKDKRNKPARIKNCKHIFAIDRLLNEEKKLRESLELYKESLKKDPDFKCCKTMKDCPYNFSN